MFDRHALTRCRCRSASSSTGSSPSGSNDGTGSATSSTSSSTPVGAIAGGVVGGVAGLAAIIGALFWWRRSRHRGTRAMREPFDGDKPGNGSHDNSINAPSMAYAVEPFVGHSSSSPMASPQFNGSQTTSAGLSGIQSTSTAPSSNGTQLRAVNDVSQAPTGYAAKLARMNAPPPPVTRTGTSSSAPLSPPASDFSQGTDAGSSAGHQDIPALVSRLVNDVLRERGDVPPEYEER